MTRNNYRWYSDVVVVRAQQGKGRGGEEWGTPHCSPLLALLGTNNIGIPPINGRGKVAT